MTTNSIYPPTVGLLLAGGASRRMGGGDKALCEIRGRTLLERVVARLEPQCESLVLNGNREGRNVANVALPLVPDHLPGRQGPLAGLLAGFDWIDANRPGMEWMLSVPIDCPFLPPDLTSRLHHARRAPDTRVATVASGGRIHHVIGLWHISLRSDLRNALAEGLRKFGAFGERHASTLVEWPSEPLDPFFNVNTPADLSEAQRLAILADLA